MYLRSIRPGKLLKYLIFFSLSFFVFFLIFSSFYTPSRVPKSIRVRRIPNIVQWEEQPKIVDDIKSIDGTNQMKISIIGSDDGSRRNIKKTLSKEQMTCNIPKLDINGTEVINFFKKSFPLNCPKEPNWVIIDDDGRILLNDQRKKASCQIQEFKFRTDLTQDFGEWKDISEGDEVPYEMSLIKCVDGNAKWELPLLTAKQIDKKQHKKREEDGKRWNVIMISFDSVSQMTFRRKLPKTVDFLENTLGTVVMNGYNIVGDGTPQAFIPIVTGATEEELPLTRKRFKNASFVDEVYPFIWKNFSEAGYVTMFAEDQATLGMFNFRLKGFKEPPTDHYARTYFNYIEKIKHTMNNQCIGSDMQHKHWLRYIREYMKTYKDIPHFGLFHHCVYSHDDINLVGLMDDDFVSWLKRVNDEGLFDDTILIVMADHGHRFAKLRNTHQGQLEERLPFYSFTLPSKIRETEEGKTIYGNIVMNKNRLSSPFDIHRTLHDIIDMPQDLTTPQSLSSRSLSIFRPIPSERSCEQAGIEPHWCTCLDWKDAMNTDDDKKISTEIAEGIVAAINEQIKHEIKICSPLKLKEIEYAKKLIPNDNLLKYRNVKDEDGFVPDFSGKTTTSFAHYQIKLATTPGRAIYEVTVRYDYGSRHLSIDLSSISHVSQYGDDPHCIIERNYFLATYCVCYDRI